MPRLGLHALFLGLLAVGALALVGGALLSPRLVSVSPAEGAVVASGAAEVVLTFSQPVRADTLADHVRFSPDTPGEWRSQGQQAVFVPQKPWPPGSTVHVQVSPGLKARNGLPLWRGKTWSFAVAQAQLAYLWPANEAYLYVWDPLTRRSHPLTHIGDILAYAPGARGRYVYFSARSRRGADLFVLDRTVLTAEGLPRTQVLLDCGADQCLDPAPAPNGRWLAYTRDDGPQRLTRVHLLDLRTQTDTVVPPADHETYGPIWSAGSTLAYYDAQRHGYVLWQPAEAKPVAFLPNDTGEAAVWSPDGASIVAVEMLLQSPARPGSTPTSPADAPYYAAHLWRYQWQPRLNRIDLTGDPNLEDGTPAFSPDGQWLAFGRKALDPAHWTPGRQVWLMSPDGRNARQITHAPDFNHLDFAWHPTLPWLVYARTNQADFTQPPEIWRYDLEKDRQEKLIVNGIMPCWLP